MVLSYLNGDRGREREREIKREWKRKYRIKIYEEGGREREREKEKERETEREREKEEEGNESILLPAVCVYLLLEKSLVLFPQLGVVVEGGLELGTQSRVGGSESLPLLSLLLENRGFLLDLRQDLVQICRQTAILCLLRLQILRSVLIP